MSQCAGSGALHPRRGLGDRPANKLEGPSVDQCIGDHSTALAFEWFVSDLVCPYGGRNGLLDPGVAPCIGLTGIAAIPVDESSLEFRVAAELLGGKSREVRHGGP